MSGETPREAVVRELPPILVGSIGGACAAVTSYPLDTLKVRVQAGRTTNLFRGIFRGVSTPLAMVTPQWAMLFWGYRAGSDAYGPEDGCWHWQRSAMGGWTAGIACSLVYCPMQAIKCTAQVQGCPPRVAVRRLWEFGGLRRGLYRGYLPALAYELPGFAVFFTIFDGLVHWFASHDRDTEPGAGPETALPISRVIAAAAIASFAESTVGMPGDTLRTRYQTDLASPSVRACAEELFRKEGVRGFYRGYRYRLPFGIVINATALATIGTVNGCWAGRQ